MSRSANRTVLLGVLVPDLDDVARLIEAAIGVSFSRHDSGYWGEYNLIEPPVGGEIRVYYNRDPLYLPDDPPEEYFFEAAFPEHQLLVSIYLPDERLTRNVQDAVLGAFPNSVVIHADNDHHD